MKKAMALILALMMMAAIVTGCAKQDAGTATDGASTNTENSGDSSEKVFRAAHVCSSMSNESDVYCWQVFQEICADYGFEMTNFEGQWDVQNEVKAIGTCIADGYDAVFSCPSDIDGIVPALMETKEAGLVVGMLSADLRTENSQYRDFFVGINDIDAGKTAAQAVAERFPNGANAVEIGGTAGGDWQIKRHDGFLEGIDGTNIVMLDSQNTTNASGSEAMAIAEDFLTKYGDEIDVIYVHSDTMVTGVIEAIKNAGYEPGDFCIIGVDGCRIGYQQVKDGWQTICISQDFREQCVMELEVARAVLTGEDYEELNYQIPTVVTADNIDDMPDPGW